jgi:hypothetical protein
MLIAAESQGMNAGDWASFFLSIAQIVAIVVAASWAYWKFLKGRTFHRRAEPRVEASLLKSGSTQAVRASVALENTGSADIPFDAKLLRLSKFTGELTPKGRAQWDEFASAPVFPDHERIESQETIRDDILIPLVQTASEGVLAYRVTCLIYGRQSRTWRQWANRKEGTGIAWTAQTVVPVGLETVSVLPKPSEGPS